MEDRQAVLEDLEERLKLLRGNRHSLEKKTVKAGAMVYIETGQRDNTDLGEETPVPRIQGGHERPEIEEKDLSIR